MTESEWMAVFSAEERAYIDRLAATYHRWAEEGCPYCGAQEPCYELSGRGVMAVVCSVCDGQERFERLAGDGEVSE